MRCVTWISLFALVEQLLAKEFEALPPRISGGHGYAENFMDKVASNVVENMLSTWVDPAQEEISPYHSDLHSMVMGKPGNIAAHNSLLSASSRTLSKGQFGAAPDVMAHGLTQQSMSFQPGRHSSRPSVAVNSIVKPDHEVEQEYREVLYAGQGHPDYVENVDLVDVEHKLMKECLEEAEEAQAQNDWVKAAELFQEADEHKQLRQKYKKFALQFLFKYAGEDKDQFWVYLFEARRRWKWHDPDHIDGRDS